MLKFLLLKIVFGKDGIIMMAMLYCQKIILGKKTFDDVPQKLKGQVAELLKESGCEDLITDPEYK